MSTLTETIEAAARPRSSHRPTRPNASAESIPTGPEPVETPCPSENGEFQAACRKLDALVAARMSVEAKLEAAELRALKHGSSPAIVAERAMAAFLGKPIGFQALDQIEQLREDCQVAKAAEGLALKHRDDLRRKISGTIGQERREEFNGLTLASYRALHEFFRCSSIEQRYLNDLQAGNVDIGSTGLRYVPLFVLGMPLGARTLRDHHQQLTMFGDGALSGTEHETFIDPTPPDPQP